MADKTNALRIPFAEWLFRMCQDDLPYQARSLAVYVAAFKINSNEELSGLSGIADRTYDKWKKLLKDEGWVIISRDKGGRGIGIEVIPAYRETPVTFTDLASKAGGKYYLRLEETETGVIVTEAAEVTGVEVAETGVIPALSEQSFPHTPFKENTNTNNKLASPESEDSPALAGLNGSIEPMLKDVVSWMVGGDEVSARNWLSKMIHINGQEVVKQSYLKLSTDMVSGNLVARPLELWGKIATRMRQSGCRGGAVADTSEAQSIPQSRHAKLREMVEKAVEEQEQKKGVRRP